MRALGIAVLLVACSGPTTPSPEPLPVEVAETETSETSEPAIPPAIPPALPRDVIAPFGPTSRTPSPATAIEAGEHFACTLGEGGLVRCWGDVTLASVPAASFTAIATSDDQACALDGGGHVTCWGHIDRYGWQNPPLEPLTDLVGARSIFCGHRRADRSIACWGNDDSGRLAAPTGAFTTLAIHDPVSCALRDDGRVLCWGLDAPSLGDDVFVDVAVAAGLMCGLTADGEVRCAGYRAARETPPPGPFRALARTRSIGGGGGICALRGDPGEVVCFGYDRIGRPPAPPAGAHHAVTVGRRFGCALRDDAGIACWGFGGVLPEGPFTALTAGEGFGCGLRRDGGLACFGDPYQGQARPPDGTFRAVAAGARHTCALRTDGTIACWGRGEVVASAPTGAFGAIASGSHRSCAIGTDGRLQCWGASPRFTTGDPPIGERVRAIAMDDYIECAVLASGALRCWGQNTQGLDVSSVVGAQSVVVGSDGVHAITRSGVRSFFLGFGPGSMGGGGAPSPDWFAGTAPAALGTELAAGEQLCSLSEGAIRCAVDGWSREGVLLATVSDGPYQSLDVGWGHGCGVRSEDGALRCWGGDAFGESHPPEGRFTSVSAGGVHTCGIREDGTLACWGSYAGQPL